MRTILLATVLVALLGSPAAAFTPEELWSSWPDERFVTTPAPCLRHGELTDLLGALAARHPEALRIEEAGRSFELRSIHLLTLGHGPRKVLLWSQMHGDEPSATPALLDLVDYLLRHADEPAPAALLDGVTLLVVPMLNPDGAERYSRRNAQGIDVNRDALNLATPEGRLLKQLRDSHQPILGFNLHDQNRRTAAGDTGKLATNAVLAVAGDAEGTITPGRLRAKRACAAIVAALAPFMPGGMARYDEDWSPRAFGDNLTAWGTPVVLIESGGLPPGHSVTDLARLNFVALLSALHELVRNDLAGHDPALYEALPRNQNNAWADVALRGGSLLQPGTDQPYRADLAFDQLRSDRQEAGCEPGGGRGSAIVEVGDARFRSASHELDATGAVIAAPFTVAVEGWRARRWLTAEALDHLSRLGVGTLRWTVPRRHADRANALAQALERPGRATLEPVPGAGGAARGPAGLVLDGPPGVEKSPTLADLLAANAEAPAPAFQPGRPASFVVLAAGPGGRIDPAAARPRSVWLDGVEVKSKP